MKSTDHLHSTVVSSLDRYPALFQSRRESLANEAGQGTQTKSETADEHHGVESRLRERSKAANRSDSGFGPDMKKPFQ